MSIVFEDRRLNAEQPWRPLDPWEESMLQCHRAVQFEGAGSALARRLRVRTLDECGCLEFEGHSDGPTKIVVEGFGPPHPTGEPFETFLSIDGAGRPAYLEFNRYGASADFRPAADLVSVEAVSR